jgi:hypothetical protein
MKVHIEDVRAYLKDNLRIETVTRSEYNGGEDGGPAYRDVVTMRLILEGDIISEATP